MFREMRRSRQQLDDAEARAVLERGTHGVLALAGDDGYPYAVPVSYVLDGERVWIHGARSGHKVDAVRRCEKASLCVVDCDDVVPERYTTHYRSAIAFGRIHVVEDEGQMRAGVERIARRYHPDATEQFQDEAIAREWKALCVLAFDIEHLTGKESRELAMMRERGSR